ncbi:MAG: 2-dehydropantoate 2-reductase [Myxococcota bacterium]
MSLAASAAPEAARPRVGVMGAGAIGCYVGGRLAAHGVPVVLVGRPSLAAEVAAHGLHLSDYRGWRADPSVALASDVAALADCDVVLVTVKSADTAAAGASLAPVLRAGAVVVSFQNGVSNADALRAALPGREVIQGMVPFNVLREDGARFHQGTSGKLALQSAAAVAPLVAALVAAGLPTSAHADMVGVAWGKLLMNLNNAVNALAGVPIKAMIAQRGYRRIMAACLREGLAALAAARIRPVLPIAAPARLVPMILGAPDFLFRVIARPMIAVDPHARSSMWDDLTRGRTTEIDVLNGEVVRLAARVGTAAPVNAAIVALVKAAEGHGSPSLSAADLAARLGLARGA